MKERNSIFQHHKVDGKSSKKFFLARSKLQYNYPIQNEMKPTKSVEERGLEKEAFAMLELGEEPLL